MLSQAPQVPGVAMRFSVPNLAGRSGGVAAKIDKALLPAKRQALRQSVSVLVPSPLLP